MALNKSKTINKLDGTSVTGDYWKIIKVDIDKQKMVASFKIALFMNQSVADSAGSIPCGPAYVFYAPVTKAQIGGDIIALGYSTIEALVAAGAPSKMVPNGTPVSAYSDLSGAVSV